MVPIWKNFTRRDPLDSSFTRGVDYHSRWGALQFDPGATRLTPNKRPAGLLIFHPEVPARERRLVILNVLLNGPSSFVYALMLAALACFLGVLASPMSAIVAGLVALAAWAIAALVIRRRVRPILETSALWWPFTWRPDGPRTANPRELLDLIAELAALDAGQRSEAEYRQRWHQIYTQAHQRRGTVAPSEEA